MARIDFSHLEKRERERHSLQTSVLASYSTFIVDGEKYFQLDTYGTKDRQIVGQSSQKVQFSKQTAEKLIDILQHEFKLLRRI
ncbi:MAG: hypothetical protein LBM77_12890 [Spirochaetaceae bacterium]|jgi:hypothetical protein|nr:hypothetical protein [Spirochaetaceae bacterium]